MQILMNVHQERSTGPHTDVRGQPCMWINVHGGARTPRQLAERSKYILYEGGVIFKGVMPVAKELKQNNNIH